MEPGGRVRSTADLVSGALRMFSGPVAVKVLDGAAWAGGSNEMPPRPLDAAIIFATVGELVPLALKAGEPLQLRVFLDGPMLEVFANGRQCVTQVVYPKSAEASGIVFCAVGGNAMVHSVDAWDMAPANFEDKRH